MNPSAYKRRYDKLRVTLEDGSTETVAVNQYRLRSMNYNETANNAFIGKLRDHGMDMVLRIDTGAGMMVVDRRMNEKEVRFRNKFHIEATVTEERPDGTVITGTNADKVLVDKTGAKIVGEVYGERDWGELTHYVFLGKGCPEHCQIVLQLAHHWGLTKDLGLQGYAAAALGLDCNGFVGNYLWHEKQGHPWMDLGIRNWELGPDAWISGYFEGKQLLTDWDQIQTGRMYIMGMVDKTGAIIRGGPGSGAGHIVITEPNERTDAPGPKGKPSFAVKVVESTAGHNPGLWESYYTYTSVSGQIFQIHRGEMTPGSQDLPMKIAAVG